MRRRGTLRGNVGAEQVAKSPPDGYTLLMDTVGTHAINAALYPKMPFDSIKDFATITLVAGVPDVQAGKRASVSCNNSNDGLSRGRRRAHDGSLPMARAGPSRRG